MTTHGIKVVSALIVLIPGRCTIVNISRAAQKSMERDLNDTTLAKFVSGGLDNIMKAMQVISSASRVGLQTMLVIAILGAAGLAIGMKLQGCLSNFAGATGKEKPKEPHSSNRLNSQPERKTF